MFIIGINKIANPNMKVEFLMRQLYGIGPANVKYIVGTLGISSNTRMNELDEKQITMINE